MTSLEISKQIYERLGWDNTREIWYPYRDSVIDKANPTANLEDWSLRPYSKILGYPAYDSDYLLLKLLPLTPVDMFRARGVYFASAVSFADDDETPSGDAEHPADALGLLVLRLADKGVLKREEVRGE